MKEYYLVGIKGSGMSSLAIFLKELGHNVTGYDDNKTVTFTQKGLDENNIPIYYDDSFNLNQDTILIYSPAFKDSHPELQRAKNIQKYSYVVMLGLLSKQFKTIAISGCHGKTTTTSLLSHVLNNIVGTNYIIGDGTAHSNKTNKTLVIEACEYRRHFLNYYPEYTIITNIDLDHIDYYKDIDDVKNAYTEFANQTKNKVIIFGDNKNTENLNITTDTLFYGLKDTNDIVAKNINESEEGTSFDLYINKKLYHSFNIPLFGKHMLLNTISVITICYLENIDPKEVEKQIKTFKGANRRFSETKINDNIIIDDYAHHPTEINATINAIKQKYPNKKIISIFQPHTYTRTKQFYKEFAEALNKTNYQYVTPIFNGSRENKENFKDVSNNLIIELLNNGKEITIDNVIELSNYNNSVIVFMSAGNINNLIEEYKKNSRKKV